MLFLEKNSGRSRDARNMIKNRNVKDEQGERKADTSKKLLSKLSNCYFYSFVSADHQQPSRHWLAT